MSSVVAASLIPLPQLLPPRPPIRHLLLHRVVCYRDLQGRCQVLRLGGEIEQVLEARLDDGFEVFGHRARFLMARATEPNDPAVSSPSPAAASPTSFSC